MSLVSLIQFPDLSAADAKKDSELLQEIFADKSFQSSAYPVFEENYASAVVSFEDGPDIEEAQQVIRENATRLSSRDVLLKTDDDQEVTLNL